MRGTGLETTWTHQQWRLHLKSDEAPRQVDVEAERTKAASPGDWSLRPMWMFTSNVTSTQTLNVLLLCDAATFRLKTFRSITAWTLLADAFKDTRTAEIFLPAAEHQHLETCYVLMAVLFVCLHVFCQESEIRLNTLAVFLFDKSNFRQNLQVKVLSYLCWQ